MRINRELGISAGASLVADDYFLLRQDAFTAISDWYHFAILDLTLLSGFRSDTSWIARKLGITHLEAKTAVERLIRLGMLEKRRGVLAKAKVLFTNYQEGITSAAHKEYQRQVVKKALYAIDNCPADHKDITSMTIAASLEKLPAAKAKIKKFRRQLCDFLEEGEKDVVYHLAVQLYPVSEIES